MFSSLWRSIRQMVVFPDPDGAEMTKTSPVSIRHSTFWICSRLFSSSVFAVTPRSLPPPRQRLDPLEEPSPGKFLVSPRKGVHLLREARKRPHRPFDRGAQPLPLLPSLPRQHGPGGPHPPPPQRSPVPPP